MDTLGKVGREKSSREVGKAQRPHGTVLFVAVSFRFRCEVKRELRQGKILASYQSKDGHLSAKTSAPVTRILPRGPRLPGEGMLSKISDERRSL